MQDKISNLDALIDYVGKDKVIGEYPLMYDNENPSYVKNLANEIWPIGISFAANFANVSITGPIIVKPITNIIPKVV